MPELCLPPPLAAPNPGAFTPAAVRIRFYRGEPISKHERKAVRLAAGGADLVHPHAPPRPPDAETARARALATHDVRGGARARAAREGGDPD